MRLNNSMQVTVSKSTDTNWRKLCRMLVLSGVDSDVKTTLNLEELEGTYILRINVEHELTTREEVYKELISHIKQYGTTAPWNYVGIQSLCNTVFPGFNFMPGFDAAYGRLNDSRFWQNMFSLVDELPSEKDLK